LKVTAFHPGKIEAQKNCGFLTRSGINSLWPTGIGNGFVRSYFIEQSGSFSSKALWYSGMDDLFLKRVLSECIRDR
jgi:hypothetical protein